MIGPNGRESTMFNLIAGGVQFDEGQILYDMDITGLPPYDRCKAGIGRSYQIRIRSWA